MKSAFAYFNDVERPTTTKLQKCFRVLQIVASLWTLAGAGINMAFLGTHNIKAEIFGIGCLLIAAGMYSLLLPLWYILRPDASK